MNTFYLNGIIQRVEQPNRNGNKSGLMVLKIGPAKNSKDALIQSVNMAIVRIPDYLEKRTHDLKPNDAVEVKGRLQGILKRTHDDRQFLRVELVAESLYPAVIDDASSQKNMSNVFLLCGVLKHSETNDQDNIPGSLIVKCGPERNDQGRSFEYVNAAMIKTMGPLKSKTTTIATGTFVEVLGHIRGVLKKIPGAEELLEIELMAERVRISHMIPKVAADDKQTSLKAVPNEKTLEQEKTTVVA